VQAFSNTRSGGSFGGADHPGEGGCSDDDTVVVFVVVFVAVGLYDDRVLMSVSDKDTA
jgi:hypothetical protein